MMRVSALDSNDDWTFGKGRANYVRNSKAIAQNVVTRLRSFTNDWFLDVQAGIDWFDLLGSRGTERRILRAVERTVLQTEGVIRIDRLSLVKKNSQRSVTIDIAYTDVFDESVSQTVELP